MKTNGDLVGGRLIDEPRVYATYAQYFVKFVRAYEAARVPVHAVTLQNEPQNRNPSAYPGIDLPAGAGAQARRRGRRRLRRRRAGHQDPRLRPQLVDSPG